MGRMQRISLLVSLFASLLTLHPLLSQQTTTSVRGVITDATGAVISGVTIDLKDSTADVHKKTTSDNKGEYQFVQLIPGKYAIDAETTGMGKQEKVVELLVAQPRRSTFRSPSRTPRS